MCSGQHCQWYFGPRRSPSTCRARAALFLLLTTYRFVRYFSRSKVRPLPFLPGNSGSRFGEWLNPLRIPKLPVINSSRQTPCFAGF